MNQYVIFVGDAAWRIAIVQEGAVRIIALPEMADAALADRAAQARGELAAAGHSGQPILLAVPSSWCLNSVISCEKLERGDRRKALAFRLEEHLPISAEEFVADYRQLEDGTALGVCADLVKLRDLVVAFEAAELPIQHICPQGLLAAAHVLAQHPDAHGVYIGGADGESDSAFIEVENGGPRRWSWFVQDGPAIRERLQEWAKSSPDQRRLYVIGTAPPLPEPGQDAALIAAIELREVGGEQAAALEAARILDGAVWPWIDFRRDTLAAPHQHQVYRRPLIAIATAFVLLLVCVIVMAQWRSRRFQVLAQQRQQGQADVFKRLFPDQRPPSAVKSRLLAEQRKLASLQGRPGDGAPTDPLTTSSALVRLRDFLKGLPSDIRFQILDLDFQPDLIRVEGQAQSHVEAERLTTALRQSGAFDVDAPKTETLKEGGVSFTFVARPHATTRPKEGT